MNRRTFFRTSTAAMSLLAARQLGAAPAPSSGDDELVAQAKTRIEQCRKAGATIRVRHADGNPISNARVKVDQLQHDFLFGCNFFMFDRLLDPELEEAYRSQFAGLLNYATLGFYWAGYEPQPGHPNYEYSERAADWCRQHRITCKGHPLAWDHPAGVPQWLPQDPSEIEKLSTPLLLNSLHPNPASSTAGVRACEFRRRLAARPIHFRSYTAVPAAAGPFQPWHRFIHPRINHLPAAGEPPALRCGVRHGSRSALYILELSRKDLVLLWTNNRVFLLAHPRRFRSLFYSPAAFSARSLPKLLTQMHSTLPPSDIRSLKATGFTGMTRAKSTM